MVLGTRLYLPPSSHDSPPPFSFLLHPSSHLRLILLPLSFLHSSLVLLFFPSFLFPLARSSSGLPQGLQRPSSPTPCPHRNTAQSAQLERDVRVWNKTVSPLPPECPRVWVRRLPSTIRSADCLGVWSAVTQPYGGVANNYLTGGVVSSHLTLGVGPIVI